MFSFNHHKFLDWLQFAILNESLHTCFSSDIKVLNESVEAFFLTPSITMNIKSAIMLMHYDNSSDSGMSCSVLRRRKSAESHKSCPTMIKLPLKSTFLMEPLCRSASRDYQCVYLYSFNGVAIYHFDDTGFKRRCSPNDSTFIFI